MTAIAVPRTTQPGHDAGRARRRVLAGIAGGDIASFKDVYVFCTPATLGVALTGSRL